MPILISKYVSIITCIIPGRDYVASFLRTYRVLEAVLEIFNVQE